MTKSELKQATKQLAKDINRLYTVNTTPYANGTYMLSINSTAESPMQIAAGMQLTLTSKDIAKLEAGKNLAIVIVKTLAHDLINRVNQLDWKLESPRKDTPEFKEGWVKLVDNFALCITVPEFDIIAPDNNYEVEKAFELETQVIEAKRSNKKLTNADEDRVLDLFRKGDSIKMLATEYNVSESTINRTLKRAIARE